MCVAKRWRRSKRITKNGQSGDIGKIWHKIHSEYKKTKKTSNTEPRGLNQMLANSKQYFVSYKTISVLLMVKSNENLVCDRQKIKIHKTEKKNQMDIICRDQLVRGNDHIIFVRF
jgi:hypothetical protein